MDSSVSPKDEIRFLRVCHPISNAVYNTVKVPLYVTFELLRWWKFRLWSTAL